MEIIKRIDEAVTEQLELFTFPGLNLVWEKFSRNLKREILNLYRAEKDEETKIRFIYAYLYLINQGEFMQFYCSPNMPGLFRKCKRKEGDYIKNYALGIKKPKSKLNPDRVLRRALNTKGSRVKQNGKITRNYFF